MIVRRGSGWLASTLLLGVCLALAAFVYAQAQMEVPEPAPSGSGEAPPLAMLPAPPNYAMAPVEYFSSILERPLFSPTRRPPAVGAVAPETTEAKLEIALVGVIISSDEQFALVRLKDAPRIVRLSVGYSVQGWILDSIEPSRISFRRGDVEVLIELTYDAPPPVQKPKRRKRKKRTERNQDPAQQIQPNTRQD